MTWQRHSDECGCVLWPQPRHAIKRCPWHADVYRRQMAVWREMTAVERLRRNRG